MSVSRLKEYVGGLKGFCYATVLAVFLPARTFAQSGSSIESLLIYFVKLLNRAIPIIITLAALFFVYKVMKTLIIGKPSGQNAGKEIITGLVVLFVLLSFWGILALVSNTLGIGVGGSAPEFVLPY